MNRQVGRAGALLCAVASMGISSAAFGQMKITEVYFNPDGNDTGTEWVELQNTSSSTINFATTPFRIGVARSTTDAGWSNSNPGVTINTGTLAVGQYLVVGPNGAGNSLPRNGNPANAPNKFFSTPNLRNDAGGAADTGVGLFNLTGGSTFGNLAIDPKRVDSVFYGVNAASQVAFNQSGVAGTVPQFNNAADTQGFTLTSNGTYIATPRGGTPGWGLAEDINGNAAWKWQLTPTVILPNGFAAAQGMRQSGGAAATSDYSSVMFNDRGNLLVTIDDESLLEVTKAGALVVGSSAEKTGGANANVVAQGAVNGYIANTGDYEGITFNPRDGRGYAINERGTSGTSGSQLYKMGVTGTGEFNLAESYLFGVGGVGTLVDPDGERNFGVEALAFYDTVAGNDRFLVGHEGTQSVYLYTLDDTANTLTRDDSFTINMGALYNENPKDLFYDAANKELYVMSLSGNLRQFNYDPLSAGFKNLLQTYRLPSAFRELGPEGFTIGPDGTLYIAQDGGAVLAFAVPEPTTIMSVTTLGMLCIARRRRRRA